MMIKIPFSTIPDALRHWATHDPHTAAFVFVDSTTRQRRILTRADVFRLAGRFAAILRHHDVRGGDVVVNTLVNSPERVVSDLGVVLAGAVTMNGQVFLADGQDFHGSLRQSSAVAVILDPRERQGAASVLAQLKESQEDNDNSRRDGQQTKADEDTAIPAKIKDTCELEVIKQVNFKKQPSLRLILNCLYEDQSHRSGFIQCLENSTESYVNYDVSPDAIAYVWTTSGTTGFSKLVPHSHRQLLKYGIQFSMACGITDTPSPEIAEGIMKSSDDRADVKNCDVRTTEPSSTANFCDREKEVPRKSPGEISAAATAASCDITTQINTCKGVKYSSIVYYNNSRLGWSGGFPGVFLALGATRVLLDLSRGPPADLALTLWQTAVQEGCSHAFFLPVHCNMVLDKADLWGGQGFRFQGLGLAGQPVTAELVRRAMVSLADKVCVFYGSSDTGQLTIKPVTMRNIDRYDDYNNGKPLPGVELKIVRQGANNGDQYDDESVDEHEEERLAGPGELGEVFIRSDVALTSYLNDDVATKKAIRADGWMTVGDVGYLDPDGDLHVVCRTSFAIMRGAYVIYPGWLEARLRHHPAIRDVIVVPIPDPVQHQELCACVVPRAEAEVSEEELRQYSEKLFLTGKDDHMTLVPRHFLFFSEGLPLTPLGKTCRRSAATLARTRLGIKSAEFGVN